MTPKRKYHRLTSSIWAGIRAEWEIVDVTLEELSARFDVNSRTLQAHFSKKRVIKGSKSALLASAVKDELFDAGLDDKDGLLRRAKDTRQASYKNAIVVENLIMAQLYLVQNDPTHVCKAASAVKLLSLAAAGLERLYSSKWSALGLDRDAAISNEMPVLIFPDLSDEEIKAIQEGHSGSDDDPDDDSDDANYPITKAVVANAEWDKEYDDVRIVHGTAGGALNENCAGGRLVRDAQPTSVIVSKP